jgi:chorismate dehydratase
MPAPGRTKVASVPYVNALPLVKYFEQEDSPIEVIFDVPSRLPALLDSGEVAAILVSSYEGLRQPGMRMAAGVCIGSDGPVDSVRLFSTKPFPQIKTLALDQSSMTSNRLAQILLQFHRSKPETITLPPDLNAMLDQADACILIGDIGMTTPPHGLHVMDLGEEWTRQVGLPFIWAAWMGRDQLTPELSAHLNRALAWSGCGRATQETEATPGIIAEAAVKPGWTPEMAATYLRQTMVYRAGEPELQGLHEFQRRLQKAGFEEVQHFPELISP